MLFWLDQATLPSSGGRFDGCRPERVEISHLMKPNVFLVGFPKSGTTSIYRSLATHPQVLAPARKEPGDWKDLSNLNGQGTDDYLALYDTTSDVLVAVDGTTRYSLNPLAAKRIKQFSPDAKIIIGIREPLSYIYSMAFQIEKNTGTAPDLAELLRSGESVWTRLNYVETLKSYFHEFGRENVFVFTYEELKGNQKALLERLVAFIGLDTQVPVSEVVSNVSMRHRTRLHKSLYRALVMSRISTNTRLVLKKSRFLKERVIPVLREKIDGATFEARGQKKRLPQDLEKAYRESYRDEVAELSDLLGVNLTALWSTKDFSYLSDTSSQTCT